MIIGQDGYESVLQKNKQSVVGIYTIIKWK